MKKSSKELKFFFAVFFVWTLFFSVSSPVLALENSFDYVSGISYEPIAKLVNFLNDKKIELEKLGDNFGKTNTAKRQTSNTANQNNARKQFLLSAVLNTAKDAVIGKPKQYFGKVFCVAKDFVFPGACQDVAGQDYVSATAPKKNNEEEINALKKQYDDAIVSANELNQKFNLLQQELGKVKAGGVIIKEPIIEQKTVERTIEKIVSGLSQDDLSASIASIKTELNNLNTNLINQINNLSFNTSRQSTAAFQAISLTNKIDSLSGTRLSGIIVNGVSGLTNADIPDDITASNYLPLTGGTVSGDLTITGNATLGVITLQNATAGYFTATSTAQASTFPYASTTALTVSGDSWFGGLSTITNLLLAGSTTLQNFTANNSTTTNATTTNLAISGSAYIGSLNGPLQANNGLVSATTSVGYQYGGTGLTATPSFGQILRGTGTGYALTATSTLGINTTDITEGSNLFWTNNRFDNRLSATTTLPNLTTLANLSITGSQVSNLNTLWDNRMSATTTLPNLTTLANLASIGTITTGIWNGTTVGVAYGGTGQTSFGQGWLNSDGTTLSASTSPTVNYIYATSTTATSTFAGGLSVAGHCVTGDTKLRRRRKKKNGEGYDYDEVEIKDIQVGDEIASLDEKTGKIVWSKVNALMDMGVKKIYKLTTASGKTIRTTAEHPYFIKNNKISSKKAIVFIDYANIKAWLRDKKLSIDLELLIKTLVSAGISDVRFYYGSDPEKNSIYNFFKKLQSFGYTVITKPIQYFKVSLFYLLKQKTNIMLLESISNAFKVSLEKEAFRMDKENVSLFAPKANFDVEISVDAIKKAKNVDVFVLFSGDGDFAYLFKELKLLGKKAVVVSGRKSLSGALIAEADKFVTLERLSDSIPGLVWSNKNAKPARRQVLKNCASNIADLLGLSNCSVDNLATNENGLWKKVVYLKEGMEIAINDVGNDKAVFDKITKIEILPEEQVYDIEVDGTHNFIGNDIVAHNTYIGGTASSTNLIVSNNSTVGTITSGVWNGTAIGDAYLTKSGDWTGTLDGQDGSYYLNASNLSNFGSPFYAFFSATNTDALAQGSTNKYWSNTLFDNRLSATTTLPNLTTLLGLTNASTTALTVSGSAYIGSLNGPLQANNGLVSATTSVGYQYGGTGLTATPSFGQILRGTGTGYALTATSTLGINTSDLTEGSNLFWTNDRFDNRLSATTTLPNLTTLATSLTGLLKGASGVISAITTSLGLAGEISDETGSGALVFGTSPTFTTQITTPSIISSGALGITPASGSNLNVNLAGAGDLAVNTNQLYVDTSTGNVGIGAMPDTKLTIDGGVTSYIAFDESGSDRWYIGNTNSPNDDFIIYKNQGGPGVALQIDDVTGSVYLAPTQGNVGIGTTTPSSKLNLHDGNFNLSDTDVAHGMTDWASTAVYGSMSAFSGTNGGLNLIGLSDTDAIAMYIQGVMGSSDPTDTTPAMVFAAQKKNGVVAQALGNAETAYQFKNYETNLMTILGSGNVGIGTTTPRSVLHVVGGGGNVATFGDTNSDNTIYIAKNSNGAAYIPTLSMGSTFTIGAGSGYGVVATNILGGASTGVYINDSGNVGIGTTTPGRTLSVTGTVGFDGLTSAVGAGSLCLDSNKQVVYNSASDACLSSTRATKHDIAGLAVNGLSLINQLQPSSFIYNQGDGRTRYGFIAEDTALMDDKLATHNEKGEITGVDDRAIMSVAVKAIKELNLKVSDLEANASVSGGQTTDSLFSWILGKFSAIGIMFGQDKLGAKKGVFESFEMKDATTGEDYCVKIRNGEWEKTKGTCGETSLSSSSSVSSSSSNSSSVSSSSSSSSSSAESSSSSSSETSSSSSSGASSSESASSSSSSDSSSSSSSTDASSSSAESSSSLSSVASSSSSSETASSSSSEASSSSVSSETGSSSSSSSSSE